MAAFNFPNSPSTNDLHTENGVTYKWNGTVWKRQNASYTDATNLNVTGIATFVNNVSIGGVLTYEDVKNVDSVGIVTARGGLNVTANTDTDTLNVSGISTLGSPSANNTTFINSSTAANSEATTLVVGHGSGNYAGMTFQCAANYPGAVYFTDTDTGKQGGMAYYHIGDELRLYAGETQKMALNSDGTTINNGSLFVADKITHNGDTNTHIRFPAADTITAETGGSERVRITSGGIVQISQASPQVQFIDSDGTNQLTQILQSGSAFYIDLRNNTNDGQLIIRGKGGGTATERLRITSAGNVGIGTDNPPEKLSIENGNIFIRDTSDNESYIYFTHTSTANRRSYIGAVEGTGNSNSLVFATNADGANAVEKLRINSDGRVLIGHGSARIITTTINPFFQLEGTNYNSALSVVRNSANAHGSYLILGKSRTGAVGGYTILQDNDAIGAIRFAGADGVDMAQYAGEISVIVDGTPGADSMPGEMIFRTNTGSGNPTEKLRITKQGIVSINDSTPESFATLQIKNHTTSNAAQILLHGADMAQIIMRDDTGGTNTKCTTIRNDQGALIFGTHNDAYSGFSDKVTITSSGMVLIGESSVAGGSQQLVVGNGGAENFEFTAGASAQNGGVLEYIHRGDGSTRPDLSMYVAGGAFKVYTGGNNERLRITSDGEIRCTGAADNKGFAVWLDGTRRVAEIIEHSSDGEIRLYTGESTPVLRTVLTSYGNSYINAAGTGDVGIGTAIPSGKLNIVTSASNALNIIQDTGNLSIRLNDRGSSSSYIKIPDGSGALTFETGSSERVRITSAGTVVIAGAANNTALVQLQDNNIGGVRVTVNDEAMSDAIYLPRDGAIVIITAFSNPDANGTNYPQPGTSGMAYVDCGPSRNIQIMDTGTTVGAHLVAKTAYTGTVSNCDNGKVTIMGGNTEGTFRIVNRRADDQYMFCITML